MKARIVVTRGYIRAERIIPHQGGVVRVMTGLLSPEVVTAPSPHGPGMVKATQRPRRK